MNLEKFYDKVYNWILAAGPKIIIAVIVFFIGQWLIRQMRRITASGMKKRNFAPSLQPFILNFVFTVLQALLVLAALQIMGIQMTIFAAVLGAFGVAAGLALSGTLQNFTSGIMILLFKPYRVGDNIVAQGQEGTVTSIEIFHTVVKAHDNKTIIIPNSKLSNDIIINLSKEEKRRLDIEFKLPFHINFDEIKKVIEQTYAAVSAVLREPALRVGISSIENDGYKIIINSWLPSHGFHDAKLSFQVSLVDALKNSGLKLPGL